MSACMRSIAVITMLIINVSLFAAQISGATHKNLVLTLTDGQSKPVGGAEISTQIVKSGALTKSKYFTDAGGTANISYPDVGNVKLRIMILKPGFVPTQVSYNEALAPIPAKYKLVLEKGGRIGGFVKDANSKPIEHVAVSILIPDAKKDPQAPQAAINDYQVNTDANGFWYADITPAVADQVYLKISHPLYVSDTRYNESTHFSINQLRELTGVAYMKLGYKLAGQVKSETGKPIAKASVLVGTDRHNGAIKTVTDGNGIYRFTNLAPDSSAITIQTPDYAPEFRFLSLKPSGTTLDFALAGGKTISGLVVDPNGNPVQDAVITADTWKSSRTLNYKTKTDAQGRFKWEHAPEGDILFDIAAKDFADTRHFPMSASGQVYKITMNPTLSIKGTVIDAITGSAIRNFKLTRGYKLKYSKTPTWETTSSEQYKDNRFELSLSMPYEFYCIKIEAPGYKPAISRDIRISERMADIEFKLVKAEPVTGTVLTEAGEKASDAIVVPFTNVPVNIENGKLVNEFAFKTVKTSSDGSFVIPPQEDAINILVLHDSGYAIAPGISARKKAKIKLSNWSVIQGVFRSGSKTIANSEIGVFYPPSMDPNLPRVSFTAATKTDVDGRFKFDHVIPGNASISKKLTLTGGTVVNANSHQVQVAPGLNSIQIGTTGRPVIGKLLPPKDANSFTFANNVSSLQTSSELPYPPGFAQFSIKQKQAWIKDFFSSPRGEAFRKNLSRVSFYIIVSTDGTFRIDDVPAGKYAARFNFFPPSARGPNFVFDKVTASAETTITVPEIKESDLDAPLDAGTIQLTRPAEKQD